VEKSNEKETEVYTIDQPKQSDVPIGCTISSDFSALQLESLVNAGITHFQVLTEFSKSGVFTIPNGVLKNIPTDKMIFHMPFYTHLLLPTKPEHRTMFRSFNSYCVDRDIRPFLIMHAKGYRLNLSATLQQMRRQLLLYAGLAPNVNILIENDAGGKDNPAPKLVHLNKVVKDLKSRLVTNIGICLDTEHAYASGDSLTPLDKSSIDLVHLNAIPSNVRFGSHLDRHSTTALANSKNGTGFIRKILNGLNSGTPVILERMDCNIIHRDLRFLKERINVKTVTTVVENYMGETVST
jgi:endonuclease IV